MIFMRKKLKLREVTCLGLPVFPFPKNYLQVNLSDQAGSAYSSSYHICTHQGQGTRSGWSLPRQPTPPPALHGRISHNLGPLGRPRAQGRTDYRLGAASLLSGIHLPRLGLRGQVWRTQARPLPHGDSLPHGLLAPELS